MRLKLYYLKNHETGEFFLRNNGYGDGRMSKKKPTLYTQKHAAMVRCTHERLTGKNPNLSFCEVVVDL